MKHISAFLLTVFILSSCNEGPIAYKTPFHENSCIKEIYKQYMSQKRSPSSIYKLDKKLEGPQLKVSVWHNHSWYYQGVKKETYFKGSKLFDYVKVDCPDGSDKNVGITDRLKNIDL